MICFQHQLVSHKFGKDGSDFETLFKIADAALYIQGKGKDRYIIYDYNKHGDILADMKHDIAFGSGFMKPMAKYELATNIVIPDYAAIFIDAFERLGSEDMEETEIYIQNVYATLFSFKNDSRVNLSMLRTALVNTRRLNKALQDMLHNMDKFLDDYWISNLTMIC